MNSGAGHMGKPDWMFKTRSWRITAPWIAWVYYASAAPDYQGVRSDDDPVNKCGWSSSGNNDDNERLNWYLRSTLWEYFGRRLCLNWRHVYNGHISCLEPSQFFQNTWLSKFCDIHPGSEDFSVYCTLWASQGFFNFKVIRCVRSLSMYVFDVLVFINVLLWFVARSLLDQLSLMQLVKCCTCWNSKSLSYLKPHKVSGNPTHSRWATQSPSLRSDSIQFEAVKDWLECHLCKN